MIESRDCSFAKICGYKISFVTDTLISETAVHFHTSICPRYINLGISFII